MRECSTYIFSIRDLKERQKNVFNFSRLFKEGFSKCSYLVVEHVLNKRFRKNHNSFLKIIEHLAQKNNKCNKKDSTTLQNCGFKVAPLAMNQIFLLRSNQKFKDFFFSKNPLLGIRDKFRRNLLYKSTVFPNEPWSRSVKIILILNEY